MFSLTAVRISLPNPNLTIGQVILPFCHLLGEHDADHQIPCSIYYHNPICCSNCCCFVHLREMCMRLQQLLIWNTRCRVVSPRGNHKERELSCTSYKLLRAAGTGWKWEERWSQRKLNGLWSRDILWDTVIPILVSDDGDDDDHATQQHNDVFVPPLKKLFLSPFSCMTLHHLHHVETDDDHVRKILYHEAYHWKEEESFSPSLP